MGAPCVVVAQPAEAPSGPQTPPITQPHRGAASAPALGTLRDEATALGQLSLHARPVPSTPEAREPLEPRTVCAPRAAPPVAHTLADGEEAQAAAAAAVLKAAARVEAAAVRAEEHAARADHAKAQFFSIRRHTPFSPYVAPRFPHMSEINSLFSFF